MNFTPIAPFDLKGNLLGELLERSEEVCLKSARLSGTHTDVTLYALKDLLRIVNSYYSNRIESQGTHPIEIEKAMRHEFSTNTNEKNLQLLSLAYIAAQKKIETMPCIEAYSQPFIRSLHHDFYTYEGMESFLHIHFEGQEKEMMAGEYRDCEVKIGEHIPPLSSQIEPFMRTYEHLYAQASKQGTQAQKLLYALSSHHRLVWIHPFLDGNGRTSRLALDGALLGMKLQGYGLWNISRGLARKTGEYKSALAQADLAKQGEFDGRGELSAKALESFVRFMLECSLDQINYMDRYLKLSELSSRIDNYTKKVYDGGFDRLSLPKKSDRIFKHLLLVGESPRSALAGVLDVSERTITSTLKELLEKGYLSSDTPKSAVRLRFNTHFASWLFPELIPEA
jgi:Fic family protein